MINEIKVTEDITIEHDLQDGWFVITDSDGIAYDAPGAVAMDVTDLPELIKALVILHHQNTGATEVNFTVHKDEKTYTVEMTSRR